MHDVVPLPVRFCAKHFVLAATTHKLIVLAKWARQKTLGLKPVKLVCRKLKALHSNIGEPRGEGIPVPERPILKKVEKLWGNHNGFC